MGRRRQRPPRAAERIALGMTLSCAVLGAGAAGAEPPALLLTPRETLAVLAAPVPAPPVQPPRRSLAASPAPALEGTPLVPRRFHVPDGYAIDLDRDPPRFAAPVDRDNMVSFELFDRGVGVFVDYDEESYPLGDGGELLRLHIEHRF